jgi:hypothetical protein
MRVHACLLPLTGHPVYVSVGIKDAPLSEPYVIEFQDRTFYLTGERTQGDWPVYRERQ